ncbi:MAG TPA: cupin domain-containing protein [Candidatus Latescibacteria bacterium]|nr:MAG: Cupin domain protein [Candidatus Latescibacteria bacterium ADurb.Bin168]HPU85871.1 cupin domain-containing protein [Candidatus Latescibacterota bacterium]
MDGREKPKYVVRTTRGLDEVRSTCGFRKSIFTEDDGAGFSVSLLRISDSKKHYHRATWETYYVLEGEGELELDGETVPLAQGTAVLIRPGVRHTARGNVIALIMGAPPFRTDDMFFD